MKIRTWKNVHQTVGIMTDQRLVIDFDVVHSGYEDPGCPMTLDPDDATPPEFDIEVELVAAFCEGEQLPGEEADDLFEDYYQEIVDAIMGG